VALPSTGGQYDAHVPLQFDLVGVSMANQYSVCPWALTSTVPMLVLRVEMTTLDPAVAGADADGWDCGVVLAPPVLLGAPLLPHAVMITAAPATIGAAHQLVRISKLSDRGA
jgi:hypothetical protein